MSNSPKKYYRNLSEIEGCEEESLWELHEDGFLYLVNDDEFSRVNAEDHPGQFYEIPDPFHKT